MTDILLKLVFYPPPSKSSPLTSQIELPEVAALFAKLAQLRAKSIPFDGTLLRSVGTRYANEADFLSGEGAAKTGGRWNGRGIRAVYGSLDVITATREAYQSELS